MNITTNTINIDFDIVILAGGRGSRMGFKDKGFLTFDKNTFIEKVIALITKYQANIFISCNNNLDKYQQYGKVITDDLPNFQGPLAGISSALKLVKSDFLLVLPVDTPLLTTQVIDNLLVAMQNEINKDICVAYDGVNIHPTIMVLKTSLETKINQFLALNERKLGFFIRQNNYKKVLIKDKKALTNYNYPKQLP